MPHGRALRRANLFRAMRQFGIIEPSGNDEVWWEADWRLQEFVFDCRHRRALASLRATSQRTRQRNPPAPRTRRVWAERRGHIPLTWEIRPRRLPLAWRKEV